MSSGKGETQNEEHNGTGSGSGIMILSICGGWIGSCKEATCLSNSSSRPDIFFQMNLVSK